MLISAARELSKKQPDKRQRVERWGSSPARGRPSQKRRFNEGQSTLEEAQGYLLLTAVMPLDALTTKWTLIPNRQIDRSHTLTLYHMFKDNNLLRTEEGHHLLVKATEADVQRMLSHQQTNTSSSHDDTMPYFRDWLAVNGGRKVELLNGQHRVTTLEQYVQETKPNNDQRWWACKIYNADTLPVHLDLKLRQNRQEAAMADSHGDVLMQVAAASSHNDDLFHGTCVDLEEKMKQALQLKGDVHFPLPRLVTIWRNERWRVKSCQWCETSVGRGTFNICKWGWMIGFRIDDFWFNMFDHVTETLSRLPGNASLDVGPDDWKKLAEALPSDSRSKETVRQLFFPDSEATAITRASTRRRRDFLAAYDDDLYWETYLFLLRANDVQFLDFHRVLALSKDKAKPLEQVMCHVVAWLNSQPLPIYDRRDNNKPQQRSYLIAGMRQFDEDDERQAIERLKKPVPSGLFHLPGSPLENASVLFQQEVLDYVLDHLSAFHDPSIKSLLRLPMDGVDGPGYTDRFLTEPWRGVLEIVRWYARAEFRPEWTNIERGGRTDAGVVGKKAEEVSRTICRQIGSHLESTAYDGLMRKIGTSEFRDDFASLLSKHCKDELEQINLTVGPRQARPRESELDPREAPAPADIIHESENESQDGSESSEDLEWDDSARQRTPSAPADGGLANSPAPADMDTEHNDQPIRSRRFRSVRSRDHREDIRSAAGLMHIHREGRSNQANGLAGASTQQLSSGAPAARMSDETSPANETPRSGQSEHLVHFQDKVPSIFPLAKGLATGRSNKRAGWRNGRKATDAA